MYITSKLSALLVREGTHGTSQQNRICLQYSFELVRHREGVGGLMYGGVVNRGIFPTRCSTGVLVVEHCEIFEFAEHSFVLSNRHPQR